MDLIDVETELRSHLATRPVPRAPGDLAERTRARHRRQRRQQAAVAGVGLAVALVFGSVPALRAVLPDVGTTEDAAAPRGGTASDLYEVPTRGSLAGDENWLQAVAALPWEATDPGGDPPVDGHRVAWAGDVAGVRVALVIGRDDALLYGAWFTGPAGAAPDQLTQATTVSRLQRNQPLALIDVPGGASSAVLVVVGLPGDTVEYETGRTVTALGHEQIDRRPLPGEDGVAAGETGGLLGLGALQAIVSRDGRELSAMSYTRTERAEALVRAPAVPSVADPRGLRGRVSADLLQFVLQSPSSFYRLDPEVSPPVLLAAGQSDDGQGETVLIGWTFPSGATLLSVGRTDLTSGQTTTHTGTEPAGVPLSAELLAVPLDGELALSGPPDAVTAEVLGADGSLLGTVPLTAGSGVGTIEGTTVRFLGADGAVLAEAPVSEIGG